MFYSNIIDFFFAWLGGLVLSLIASRLIGGMGSHGSRRVGSIGGEVVFLQKCAFYGEYLDFGSNYTRSGVQLLNIL